MVAGQLPAGLCRTRPRGGNLQPLRHVGRGEASPELLAPPQLGKGHDIWDACWLPDGRTVLLSIWDFGGGRALSAWTSLPVACRSGRGRIGSIFHKCFRQGAVLAFDRPTQGQTGSSPPRWRGTRKGAGRAWGRSSSATRTGGMDGRSIIGMDAPSREDRALLSRPRRADRERWRTYAMSASSRPTARAVDGPRRRRLPLVLQDRSTSDIYALDWEAP